MASHGIARTTSTTATRTPEQRAAELAKIAQYRALEDDLRAASSAGAFADPTTFATTTKLLRANPEYYTAWNVRRRCITSGLLSRRSAGSWPSKASPSSSQTATAIPSSGGSSTSSSSTIPQDPACRTAGRSGTTAESAAGAAADDPGGPDADLTSRPLRGEVMGDDASAAELSTTQDGSQTQEQEEERAQENDLQVLESELAFTIPLLLEFPKCYWIWEYRLWTLERAIDRLPTARARAIWEAELGLVGKLLTRDRRNFHAWGYRRHVVGRLESDALGGGSLVEQEFDYTSRMIRVDLSNFSAWHNRSQLIPRLLAERNADDAARQTFLDDELSLIREALNVGPEDQSLWYYHQFLVLNLTEPTGRPTIAPRLTQEDRVTYLLREMEDIRELLEDYTDVKWIYEALMEYTLALSGLEARQTSAEEKDDLRTWLAKLRELDPMRSGRWSDVEKECSLR